MKKFIACIVLLMATAIAMATPRPSEIEDALAAHDYATAKSLTQEVLRDRPESAKAHLFNAYVLLKADNNRGGAAAELTTARQLDKNHSVQNSALFGRTVAELERAPVSVRASYVTPAYQAPVAYAAPVTNYWGAFFKWLFWMSIVGLIIYLIARWINRPVITTCTGATYEAPRGTSRVYNDEPRSVSPFGTGLGSRAVHRAPSVPYASTQPVQHTTTVVHDSGMNNMVTGMMLGSMMSDHGHHHGYGGYDERPAHSAPTREPEPRYEAPVESVSTRDSYSSGGSDSWSSGSSGSSSSSDSWSSSDSGSSSSDSGGGGDW